MIQDTEVDPVRQHRKLDHDIKKASNRPGMCSTALRAMKREKLRLKDQIEGLVGT